MERQAQKCSPQHIPCRGQGWSPLPESLSLHRPAPGARSHPAPPAAVPGARRIPAASGRRSGFRGDGISQARTARAGGFHGDAVSSTAQPEPEILPRCCSRDPHPAAGPFPGTWVAGPSVARGCLWCYHRSSHQFGDSAGTPIPAALNILGELPPALSPSRAGTLSLRLCCHVLSGSPRGGGSLPVLSCLERKGGNPRVPR